MDQPPQSYSSAPPQTSKLAIFSLVLGLVGLFCLSIFGGIPAIILGHKARRNIRESRGAEGGAGMALAGLILGYVSIAMAVISLIVAIPMVIQAKKHAQTVQCVNNLRMIDFAKEQWAAENEKDASAVPTPQDLDPLMEKPFEQMVCPLGGTYSINAVGQKPTCSIPGHKLN
jgi:uncharacterized membrane protein YjfL (UPF0719 family)